jgi:hypothetical protein
MFSVTILGHARLFPNRARLFSGVALSALVIGAVANAQQQPTPQQQEQQTPSAPAESQDSGTPAVSQAPEAPATSQAPAASEAPAAGAVTGQKQLPQIVVSGSNTAPKKKRSARAQQPSPQDAPTPAQAALNAEMTKMNAARDTNILPKIGATTYTFTREAIVSMPQGDNAPIDKLILQFPGVSYDSAASNPNFHVRSEYANVQTGLMALSSPRGCPDWAPSSIRILSQGYHYSPAPSPRSMACARPACSISSAEAMQRRMAKSCGSNTPLKNKAKVVGISKKPSA